MDHRKKLFQIISCALSLALLGSCAPDSAVSMESGISSDPVSFSEERLTEKTSSAPSTEHDMPQSETETTTTTSPAETQEPKESKTVRETETETLPSYSENIETTAPETSTEDVSFSRDRLTEETLEALLEKNREFHGMFSFLRGTKWISEPAAVTEIEFTKYESFEDFRNSIYSTYTEEYAAYLLENYLNKGEKSFFEDESGKIYMNLDVFGTLIIDAFRYGRESYTFQIVSSDSSVCEFLFSFRVWNEYGSPLPGVLSGEDTIVTLKCKAVREKDGWRLPYMICDDYDQTEIIQ